MKLEGSVTLAGGTNSDHPGVCPGTAVSVAPQMSMPAREAGRRSRVRQPGPAALEVTKP
jgi:hypothetical protein